MTGRNHFVIHHNGVQVGLRFGAVSKVDAVHASPGRDACLRLRFEGGASEELAVPDFIRLLREGPSLLASLNFFPECSGAVWGDE